MTPAEFLAIRNSLGLTQHAMARALRMMGKSAWQSINEWENGKRLIPGPVQVAMQSLLAVQIALSGNAFMEGGPMVAIPQAAYDALRAIAGEPQIERDQ